ncbi:sodium-dependent transporter [Ekhidna sp.]|uniref:sodium-dependent transporter n=1 Tax=Ekhidna sp. TaxID=2608089 RepID=UPI0032977512
MSKEQFSNRWGIVLAALGMAIGAGNLWRFPRLAGQYGGSFILLWILFLFIWSIPLLLSEFAIGKKYKSGVIGSFAKFAGKKYTWMGFFITMCTLGIAFYYAIVTAWSFRYLTFSVNNIFKKDTLLETLQSNPDYLSNFWGGISNGDYITVITYICVILLAVFILIRGVKNGLEKANKLLIPSLFVLLLVIVIVSLNMEGGIRGLEYMFAIDWSLFSNPTIWIEALSQSAWSTGAGWGLMMTLSAFSRDNEDVTLNTFIGAFGNNTASLLSGMAILPAVFALAASDAEAISYLQTGNQALTFTIIPMLFANVPGGDFLSVLFFLALFVAAFSSLLPMIELFLQNVADLNISKRKTLLIVIVCFVGFGFPSAWSLDFFSNQDWVWGVGLIVTGLFILIAVAMNNPIDFKESTIDVGSDMILSSSFFRFAIFTNIAVGFFLIYWWLSQDYSAQWLNENGQWDLFGVYSNASTITQWAIVIITGLILNGYLYKKFVKQ